MAMKLFAAKSAVGRGVADTASFAISRPPSMVKAPR